jgi:GAF domain-containing protein
MGFFDYIFKSRSMHYRRHTDDLLLSVADLLRHSAGVEEVIPRIQQRVADFIQAERSTIYLWEESAEGPVLRAQSVVGSAESKPLIRASIPSDQGILGYVCKTRVPLLIRNIGSDMRFQGHLAGRTKSPGSYKTGSCMLFPLIIHDRLVGVMTIADKRGRVSFNRYDFSLLHIIAKDLAMVILAAKLGQGRTSRSVA